MDANLTTEMNHMPTPRTPSVRRSGRPQKKQGPISITDVDRSGIERHDAPAPIPAPHVFECQGTLDPPAVSTIVRRSLTTPHLWEVELRVDQGRLHSKASPELQRIAVSRQDLLARRATESAPSMPSGGGSFATRPRPTQLRERPKLRFGNIEYEPTTVFAPDGRKPYYDTRYPWRCLVWIETAMGWSGSGVLIGPRHVLTASHCVNWPSGWLKAHVLHSGAGDLDVASGTHAYASTHVPRGRISDSDSDEDYAVIVLDRPIGGQFGWYGVKTYDSAWDDATSKWWSVGYPQDVSFPGATPCFQTNFMLNELGADFGSARLIRSETFDNWPGQSGSPVFGFWPTGPYVVGVVSGEGPNYNYISGGSLLTSLVHQARTEHP